MVAGGSMRQDEARTCHGEPGPVADPDTGDVGGHTVEDAAVLSSKACDLQDSLGQQRVPVVGGTVNHQHNTTGPRTLSITDTVHHPAAVPVSLSSSQTHSGTLTGGRPCNSSLSNKQSHADLLTDSVLHLGPKPHRYSVSTKWQEHHPRGCRQAFFKAQTLDRACLLVIP